MSFSLRQAFNAGVAAIGVVELGCVLKAHDPVMAVPLAVLTIVNAVAAGISDKPASPAP